MEISNIKNSNPKKSIKVFKLAYILFVLLPFLLGVIYFNFIATSRYVSGAGFAVRSMTSQNSGDLLGSVTGLVGSGSSTSDSYIIIKFLESRDLLESLMFDCDFNDIYCRNSIDFISRVPEELKIEERLKSWKRYIRSSFYPSSGIIRFEVHAFDPNDAYKMSSLILEKVKYLTNELSEQARKDAMYYSQKELSMAEERLLNARTNLMLFRKNTNSVDLNASAMAQIELLTNLDRQLIEIKTRIEVLRDSLNENAPSIKVLERKAKALEVQISQKKGGLKIAGHEDDLSSLLSHQEELETEKAFAECITLSYGFLRIIKSRSI